MNYKQEKVTMVKDPGRRHLNQGTEGHIINNAAITLDA